MKSNLSRKNMFAVESSQVSRALMDVTLELSDLSMWKLAYCQEPTDQQNLPAGKPRLWL